MSGIYNVHPVPGGHFTVWVFLRDVQFLSKRDIWIVIASLILLPMFFHQCLEIQRFLSNQSSLSFPSELTETLANVLGTFVILLLANSRNQLKETLEEKNTLLREIHHRVKNNLQIVASFVENISSQFSKKQKIFDQLNSRIRSMAMVHEQLHTPGSVEEINPEDYFKNLVDQAIRAAAQDPAGITKKIQVDIPDLNLETVLKTGLIVNELVSNALARIMHDKNTVEHNPSGRQPSMAKTRPLPAGLTQPTG